MSAILALTVPLACALVAAIVSMMSDAFGRLTLSRAVAACGLAASAVVAGVAAFTTTPSVVWRGFAVGAGYSTASVFAYLLGALAIVSVFGDGESGNGSFSALVALGSAACAALASATDVVMMLIALELIALVGYALVAQASTRRAHEAAMKYFVQGAVATALFVMGLAVTLISGALVVSDGSLVAPDRGVDVAVASVGVVLLLAAFSFKLAAFPFHSWAPDAYETARPSAVAFLSSAPKVATFVALSTLLFGVLPAGGLTLRTTWFVAFVAGASLVFGNLAALRQRNLGRMLGYSGIAQAGYALTALVVRNGSLGLMFIAGYAMAVAALFAAACAIARIRPSWDGSISGLAGLGTRAPMLSAAMSVSLFSLTGIPPFFGFWGKFLVFMNAASDTTWLWLVFVGLLGSAVSFGYYGGVLRAIYFESEATSGSAAGEALPAGGEGEESAAAGPVSRGGAPAAVAIGLATVIVLAGLVPLVWGFGRLLGFEPAGLFVLGLLAQ